MGCFLACFGSSKDRKRRKRRHKVQPRDQRYAAYNPVQSAVSLVQNHPEKEKPTNSVSEIGFEYRDNSDEQLSLSARKKVTFNSNVTTYEHISVEESTESFAGKEDGGKMEKEKEKEKEKNLAKLSQSQSSSEDSSVTSSSSGSYPSNHRYQNCRDSDDELDYGESDIEDEDDEDEDDYDDIYEDDGILESRSKVPVVKGTLPFTEEVDSLPVMSSLLERDDKPGPNARDRSGYVHSVLNPVENLTQWKAVQAKGTPTLQQQKENLTLCQEPRISFSSAPSFRELSFSFKGNSDQSKKSNQEAAVDASLSNWLGSSESTPINKTSTISFNTITPEKSMSLGSNSPRSFEDRPILGALTVEELKQFSASSSPRRSPSRSPDEVPIIGTVGTYWNHSSSGKDSGSASSFKGIPNTTSKYREDQRVNWHSTPFETRLERALNGGVHTSNVL